jgi:hypothetical protein
MKKLNDILNESASEVEIKLLKSVLKTLGFKAAKPGNNTYYTNVDNIIELYGLPMRAGKYADIFVAITDNASKPYSLVDIEGTLKYAKVNDIVKELQKRSNSIKEGAEETDPVGEALALLDEITEMTEEIYDCISDQENIDDDIVKAISNIYATVDELYTAVDEKYDIDIDDGEYEYGDVKMTNESVDYAKFKQLAAVGLVDETNIQPLVLAVKNLEDGKTLTPSQKDLIMNTFLSLVGIITGDSSLINTLKRNIKS